jgi:hypothetical protein
MPKQVFTCQPWAPSSFRRVGNAAGFAFASFFDETIAAQMQTKRGLGQAQMPQPGCFVAAYIAGLTWLGR